MNKRILIIDDDDDILEMLDIVFQASDIDVILSNKGMTGDEINAVHPDLILLDIQIKGYIHTGDEICKEIKANNDLNNIPVFLISSETDLDLLAIECEADGYFSKPFDILKLKSAIRNKLI
jgi:two-component system, OmpR family, response regulator VicR